MRQLEAIKFDRFQVERMEKLGQEQAHRLLYEKPSIYNAKEFKITLNAVSELGGEVIKLFRKESSMLYN